MVFKVPEIAPDRAVQGRAISGFRGRWRSGLFGLFLLLSLPSSLFARTHHYTSFSDRPEIFLRAIADYKNSPHSTSELRGKAVRAGVITHHFLANRMMVDFFESLASQNKPDRIILIGPDHSRKGLHGMSLSSLPWKTPFGKMSADTAIVKEIKECLSLDEDVEAFGGEHSVGIIIPFIHYYFPKSKVVPILVQKQAPHNMLIKFARLMRQYSNDPETIIILSMDFSHNQTSEEADRRDAISKDAIQSFNFDKIDKLDIDSPSGLFILLAALKKTGDRDVYFRDHSNSSKITKKSDLKSVTSYYTIFFFQ